MKCPTCANELTEKEVGGITVDVCEGGCAGIWFDRFELEKVDESHEHAGEALLDIPKDPNLKIDYEARRQCPRCDGITMQRHCFSVKQSVTIDKCAGCGGTWLDIGELRDIRGLYETAEERSAAADAYFTAVMAPMQAELDAQKEKIEARREKMKAFKYLLPSYYIPGEQGVF